MSLYSWCTVLVTLLVIDTCTRFCREVDDLTGVMACTMECLEEVLSNKNRFFSSTRCLKGV